MVMSPRMSMIKMINGYSLALFQMWESNRIKVYNSTEDNILDTNYAYDNISMSEILRNSSEKSLLVSGTSSLRLPYIYKRI